MLPEPKIISHHLEIGRDSFLSQIHEEKRFELVKSDGRFFSVGQHARINEINMVTGIKTGNFAIVEIIYVINNAEGLHYDYCILGTELICFQYESDGNGD